MTIVLTWWLPLNTIHANIRKFLRFYFYMLKKICLIDYVVEGAENIPKDRVGIFMSKHQSTWETFFLPLYFYDPAAIAKRELVWIPFFGWAFAISRQIMIDRKNKTSAMQQIIKKGGEFLKQGRWIMVFPEGTRVAYGQVGKYHLGGARLAVATNYPVIPVAHNAGRFWPRRGFIKQPGTVHVVIGPEIKPEGRTAEEVLELTKTWIENTDVAD